MTKSLLYATSMVLVLALLNLNLATSHRFLKACHVNGYLQGKSSHCSTKKASYCCEVGKMYPQYRCSPPITGNTRAIMTITSFAKSGDGEGTSESDNRFQNSTGFAKSPDGSRSNVVASFAKDIDNNRSSSKNSFVKGTDGSRFNNISIYNFTEVTSSIAKFTDESRYSTINSFTKGTDATRSNAVTSFAMDIDNNRSSSKDSFAKGTDGNRFNNISIDNFAKVTSSIAKHTDENRYSTINSFTKGTNGGRINGVTRFANRSSNKDSFTKSTDGNRFGTITISSFTKVIGSIAKGTDDNRYTTVTSFTKGGDGVRPSTNKKRFKTIDSFIGGGNGQSPSKCDNRYHNDNEMIVALSTGWYNGGSRCLKNIKINANGRSVLAKVVDECDSVQGCDSDHDFQPPCPNNIVKASPMVWKALDIPESKVGNYDIAWSDE